MQPLTTRYCFRTLLQLIGDHQLRIMQIAADDCSLERQPAVVDITLSKFAVAAYSAKVRRY